METRGRRSGMTLLEIAVSTAILMLLLGSIAVVFSAMTAGTSSAEANLLAQSECERGLLALVNDLQTTDSVGKDLNGVPYFKIEDRGAGTANAVVFRRVEGFSADVAQDVVNSVYGPPIQYFVDAGSNLVRVQGGTTRAVANRVSAVKFTVTPTGRITIELTTFTGHDARRVETGNSIQVTPRNAQKL